MLGFMTQAELENYKAVESDVNLYWLPGLWFSHRLREAQAQGRIIDPYGAQLIMKVHNVTYLSLNECVTNISFTFIQQELLEFRSKCGILWSYDWVSIPLVYTQVSSKNTETFAYMSFLSNGCDYGVV